MLKTNFVKLPLKVNQASLLHLMMAKDQQINPSVKSFKHLVILKIRCDIEVGTQSYHPI